MRTENRTSTFWALLTAGMVGGITFGLLAARAGSTDFQILGAPGDILLATFSAGLAFLIYTKSGRR